MKRYSPDYEYDTGPKMSEDKNGGWVDYDDAMAEIERLKVERDEAVSQLTTRLRKSHELRRALDALELHRVPELEAEIKRLNAEIAGYRYTNSCRVPK